MKPTDAPALSAAPPRAILIWCDGVDIYAEFPGPSGRPEVLRYPLTTAGLASALSIVRTRTFDTAAGRHYTPSEPTGQPGTAAQRENTRVVLRRMGVLG